MLGYARVVKAVHADHLGDAGTRALLSALQVGAAPKHLMHRARAARALHAAPVKGSWAYIEYALSTPSFSGWCTERVGPWRACAPSAG